MPDQPMVVDPTTFPQTVTVNTGLPTEGNQAILIQQPNPYMLNDQDDDICAICQKHYNWIEGKEMEEMTWIQCSHEPCGKWYHVHCVGMSEEEYQKNERDNLDWFCKDQCKQDNLK